MVTKCILLLSCCCIALIAASPLYHQDQQAVYNGPTLIRHVRSPGSGSLDIGYTDDRFGRVGTAQYTHNIYDTDNFKLNAYAQGTRNYDYNSNGFGGGIGGSWRF